MPLCNSLRASGLASFLGILALTACATSQVMVGKARAPISADQVRIYLEAPANRYDKIAMIESSSKHSFTFTADAKTEAVIKRLKRAAAKLGANGILLQSMDDEAAPALGGAAGTTNYSNHGVIDLGFGGFTAGGRKSGNGLAIYVEPDRTPGS